MSFIIRNTSAEASIPEHPAIRLRYLSSCSHPSLFLLLDQQKSPDLVNCASSLMKPSLTEPSLLLHSAHSVPFQSIASTTTTSPQSSVGAVHSHPRSLYSFHLLASPRCSCHLRNALHFASMTSPTGGHLHMAKIDEDYTHTHTHTQFHKLQVMTPYRYVQVIQLVVRLLFMP